MAIAFVLRTLKLPVDHVSCSHHATAIAPIADRTMMARRKSALVKVLEDTPALWHCSCNVVLLIGRSRRDEGESTSSSRERIKKRGRGNGYRFCSAPLSAHDTGVSHARRGAGAAVYLRFVRPRFAAALRAGALVSPLSLLRTRDAWLGCEKRARSASGCGTQTPHHPDAARRRASHRVTRNRATPGFDS